MLLKLSLVDLFFLYIYIFKINHPPPCADARCILGWKPAVFVSSAVNTSTLADVCNSCITLLACWCLACIKYKHGQLLDILLMLMVVCLLSSWTYYTNNLSPSVLFQDDTGLEYHCLGAWPCLCLGKSMERDGAPFLLGTHSNISSYAATSSADSQIESEWVLVINLETLCQ